MTENHSRYVICDLLDIGTVVDPSNRSLLQGG
jgi:hypothetical protein